MIDPVLQSRLNEIPHLDLGLSFDIDRLRLEAAKISDYVGYETIFGTLYEDMYRKAWQGRTIIGFDGDSRKGMQELTPENWQELQARDARPIPTDLASDVPYMMEIAHQLDAQHERVRVMVVSKDSHLAWHSHVQRHGQPPEYMTVHIPIQMPEDFTYEVTRKENLDRVDGVWQLQDPKAIYSARYPVARATCFNSYHYHNVFNRNPQIPRISIMLYMDLNRAIPRKIFESAVCAYSGVVIS